MKRNDLVAIGAFAAVALLWFVPLLVQPGGILFWRGGAYSDLQISHLPNAEYLRRSLTQWGQIPLWNANVLSGAPFAADPLTGLWYPPNWLAVVLPAPAAFQLLLWAHLLWASIGTWRLARRLGASNHAGIIAGLAFGASPKLVGHAGLGHVSLIFAVSWTPWLLLAISAALASRAAAPRLWLRWTLLAGCIGGLVLLADPRWYLPLLLLSGGFLGWRLAHSQSRRSEPVGDSPGMRAQGDRDQPHPPKEESGSMRNEASPQLQPNSAEQLDSSGQRPPSGRGIVSWRPAGQLVLGLLVGLAGSLGTGAALVLPLLEFSGLSTRQWLDLAEAAASSLPVESLPGLLASDLAVWPEWQLYSGITVLLLALLGLVRRGSGRWFWAATATLALLVALGDRLPLFALLRVFIPGFSQLRVPPRALFVSGFALAMLAASGFDRLDRRSALTLGAITLAGLTALGIASWLRAPAEQRPTEVAPWILSIAFAGMAMLWASTAQGKPLVAGLGVILVLDLAVVNFTTLEVRPIEADPAVEIAADLVGEGQRAFSPSYSLSQPSAARRGLELADGVNPLQLVAYRDYLAGATGFNIEAYSVTLPPFPGGEIEEDWGFDPDADRLGLLAVSLIVSAYPVENAQLQAIPIETEQYFYRNRLARPRAWIEGPTGIRPVADLSWRPNTIVIRTDQAGTLVLAELAYPGWQASIDGELAEIEPRYGILRSVQLPQGTHQVEFEYRPATVYAGALITTLTLLVLGSLWVRR